MATSQSLARKAILFRQTFGIVYKCQFLSSLMLIGLLTYLYHQNILGFNLLTLAIMLIALFYMGLASNFFIMYITIGLGKIQPKLALEYHDSVSRDNLNNQSNFLKTIYDMSFKSLCFLGFVISGIMFYYTMPLIEVSPNKISLLVMFGLFVIPLVISLLLLARIVLFIKD